jgi:CheY-like chemotaxis protein
MSVEQVVDHLGAPEKWWPRHRVPNLLCTGADNAEGYLAKLTALAVGIFQLAAPDPKPSGFVFIWRNRAVQNAGIERVEISELKVVLVAEDDALISITLTDMLADADFEAVLATNAQEAISVLEDDTPRFCALLTDIRMPGKGDGWDVARRARELQPSIPVIYMTGDSADQWRAHGVPGSVLLQKPFVAAQLITALTTLLNEAGMAVNA